MTDSIVARLPASRKSSRNWTGPLLALLAVPLLIGAWLFAFPKQATEAEFRQVLAEASQAETAAAGGFEADMKQAGLPDALKISSPGSAPNIEQARQAIVVARGLTARRHKAGQQRLADMRARTSELRLPGTRKAIVLGQVDKRIDAAAIAADRAASLEKEFLTTADEFLGFLALKRGRWTFSRGKFVFTDWYDSHGFAARRDRLQWLAEQGAGLEKEARRTRLAVAGDGYRWPAD